MSTPQAWLTPSLHPVYARLVCAELGRRGFSEEYTLSGTHLEREALHNDKRFLSFAQFRRLVLRAQALSQCPWLGLNVGDSTHLAVHGALGMAVMACGTVAQALLLMQRFATLRERVAFIEVETDSSLVLLLHETVSATEVREYLLGHFAGGLLRVLETISGQNLRAQAKISWPFAEPEWAQVYRDFCPQSSFAATQLRIELPLALLTQPTLAPDPETYRLALRDCEQQLKQQQLGSLSLRVQQRLLACQGNYPSLEQMAASEHMSPRTLIRHLREEGGNYQQLLDHVRSELACWLLLQTPLSIEAIAEQLGYQDSSNFSRTFRRWLGITPRDFRQGASAETE
jgi:AraC-like DNA-binding protein